MPRAFLVKRFGTSKEECEGRSNESYDKETAEIKHSLHSRHCRSTHTESFGEFCSSEFKLNSDVRVLSPNRCMGKFITNQYFEDFVVATRGINSHRMFNIKDYQFLDLNKGLILGGCKPSASQNGMTDNHHDLTDARDSTDDSLDDPGDYDWCDEEYDSNNNSTRYRGASCTSVGNSNAPCSLANRCSIQGSKCQMIQDEDSDDSVFVGEQAQDTLLHHNRYEGGHEKLKLAGKPQFQCTQCDKTFKTKYTLNIHRKMPSHTTLKPFVCPTCGKGFRLSSTLCRHKIIHTSQRPHRCHVCQKSFNRSSTLKTHLRTHSNVKEFTCSICGKGFHQKGNLRNHVLIHTGEKPYECSVCKKSFNKLSNLKFHMHSHTDQKPYRCRYCKQSFSKRAELKHHIAICKRETNHN